jgi:hypothetical protein
VSKQDMLDSIERELLGQAGMFRLDEPAAFVCAYGSNVYGAESDSSDFDYFCATSHEKGAAYSQRLGEFTLRLHKQYGREIDEEVPFANKLTYTFAELDDAVLLVPFEADGIFLRVPPVRKTPEFLASKEIKLRLALNALTTPNNILANDSSVASKYSNTAELSATLLGIGLLSGKIFRTTDIQEMLCISSEGKSGEMFLGYKTDHQPVMEKLDKIINRSLDRLVHLGAVSAVSPPRGLYVRNTGLMPKQFLAEYLANKK